MTRLLNQTCLLPSPSWVPHVHLSERNVDHMREQIRHGESLDNIVRPSTALSLIH